MAIYFIRAGDAGPVKIGYARYPAVRLRQIQSYHYEKLSIIRVIHRSQAAERWVHEKFSQYNIRGEWFSFDDEMLTIDVPDIITLNLNREDIVQSCRDLGNFSDVARLYGVSREYIRQIANKHEEATGEILPRKHPGAHRVC